MPRSKKSSVTRTPKVSVTNVPVPPKTWDDLFTNPSDSGLTVTELATKYKIPRTSISYKLERLVAEGQCTKGFAVRQDARGRTYHATVYQLKGTI
jgi:predicted ArsR family transcriptional regulator